MRQCRHSYSVLKHAALLVLCCVVGTEANCTFVEIQSMTCVDHAYEVVISASMCTRAATNLSKPKTVPTVESETTYPTGCYYGVYLNSELYYNTQASTEDCTSSTPCLCSDDCETPAPDTAAPQTLPPRTSAPPTSAPPTASPPTSVPLTASPPTIAPQTNTPTSSPATAIPSTVSPPTQAPPTQIATDAPSTAQPPPPTFPPRTDIPATRVPTNPPETTAPSTSSPATDSPATNSPATSSPPTGIPPTGIPPTGSPPTGSPPTGSPPTGSPPTGSPPTDSPPIPPTNSPPTESPPVPSTDSPPTDPSASPTDTPSTPTTQAAPIVTQSPEPPTTTAPPTAPHTNAPLQKAPEHKPHFPPTVLPPVGGVEAPQQGLSSAATFAGVVSGGAAAHANMLLLMMDGCSAEDKKLPWSMQPLQLTVSGNMYAGAVVGNVLLVIIAALVFGGLYFLIAKSPFRSVVSSRFQLDDPMGVIRFPAGPMYVALFLYQGTVYAAMHLVFYPPNFFWGAIGVVITGLCAMVPFAVFRIVREGVPKDAFVMQDDQPLTQFELFLIGPGEWVSRKRSLCWVKRWSSMMRPFTEKWAHFISFDFIAMFLLACVTVPRTASFIGCGAVKLLIALINCLQLGADLYCRPHNRYRDNWADIARFSLQAVASFAMAIGYFTDDPVSSMFTLAVYLFLASMLFLILKLVFDLGAEVYLLFKSRRPRLQEKAWSEDEGGEMMTPSFDHKMLHNIHSPHDDLESSDLSSSKKLGYVMSPRSDLDRIVEVKESDLAYIRTGSEYLPPAHRKGSDTLDSVRSNQSPSRKTSRRVSRKNSAALPPRDTDEFRPPSRVNSQLRIALPHDCRSTSPDDGLARSPTVGSPRRTSRRKTAPSCDVREDLSPEPTNSAAGSPGPRYPTPQARLPPVAKALSPKASTDGCVQSTDEPSQNARNSRRTSRRESVPVDKMVPMAAQEFVSVDGEPAGGAGLARRASRAKAGGKEIADLNLVPTTSDAELSGSGLSACNSGSPGDKSLFSLRRKPEANAARTGCLELSIGHASSDPESASQGAQQIPPLPPKSSFWKPPTVSPAASPKTLGSPSFPQTFSKPPKAASPLPRPSPRNAEEDII